MLQRWGCGAAAHGCQGLPSVLHKLILRGSKVLEVTLGKASEQVEQGALLLLWPPQMEMVEEEEKGSPTHSTQTQLFLPV